jgi:hypothetical protein
LAVALAAISALAANGQDDAKGPDQADIDRAICRGVEYLKQRIGDPRAAESRRKNGGLFATDDLLNCDALILLTFAHAGLDTRDDAVQKILSACIERPARMTYQMAFLAMSLQKLDPARYRSQIALCGQFFADTQCENGQWSYPHNEYNWPLKRGDPGWAESATTIRIRKDPKIQRVQKTGDNSNSQFAALGIRACQLAGVSMPADTLKRACAWWERAQNADGGWAYRRGPEATSTGSMTCGAIGSLAILKTLLNLDISKDRCLQKGYDWLENHFSVKENPQGRSYTGKKDASGFYFYYLYSVERAGDLTSKARWGPCDWYCMGAKELLRIQEVDGSWKSHETPICATCFAILFLERATRSMGVLRDPPREAVPQIKTGE